MAIRKTCWRKCLWTRGVNTNDDDWVKKINALANEMDEIAGSVHPSVAMALTADLREKYKSLAQSLDILPTAKAGVSRGF